ncbi:accessory factor UbiK family protein [Sneathiella chungangensis]|uniref:Accessory factor UbiK family protein n=1 Tax=Sneathiella chungangensis TaxID=1418234 RepID=A0A845MG10_9PROT|nr:accessory factor UbiK family protein [Sneathiella chungangensis]MZR22605.1 accessory factor UbiK family protein [Sneathiella chungangensis]
MQTNSRLFDDLARLATGALGTAQGVKAEWENLFHQRLERFISEMDLVPREEFDAVKAMVVLAREENDALKERLAALEKKIDGPAKAARARKNSPSKGKATASEK